MADLNALIAQGVQVKEPPNPFAQYAQMQQLQHGEQQNQMNQMAMQEKQRGFQEMNALRGLMSSPGFDLATPKSQRDVYNVAPTRAEEIIKGHYVNLKTAADIENLKRTGLHSEAQTKDLAIKAIDQTFSNFTKLNSPLEAATSEDGVRRYITNLYNDPLLGAISAKKMPLDQAIEMNVAAAAKDPQAWITAHSGLTGEHIFKTLQDTTTTTDLGGTSITQRRDAFGRPIGGPVVTAKTPVLSTAAALEQARAATSNAATNQARETRLAKGPVGTSLTAEQNDALFGENGAVAAGKLNPNKINSRNATMWADAFLRNPNADPVKIARDVETTTKAIKDFGTGPQGVKITSFNTAIDHLDTLSQLGAALKNNDMVAFNNVANFFGVQAGQPAATMYNQAARIVGAEIAKAIVPNTGTGKEREETAKAFNSASSPDQLAGADAVAKKLLGGQLASLEQQYRRTTKREDFAEQLLSPAGRKAYQSSRSTPADAAAKPSLGEIFR